MQEILSAERERIDRIDREIAQLLSARFALTDEIGRKKKERDLPIADRSREDSVFSNISQYSVGCEESVRAVYRTVLDESKKRQI